MFTLQTSGKQQGVNFDTVKEALTLQIQKTYRYGKDLVAKIREMKYSTKPCGKKPTRQIVTYDPDKNKRDKFGLKLE